MIEKSTKVNESQFDFLGRPAEEGLPCTHVDCERMREMGMTGPKPCPFCGKELHRYEEDGEWVIECLTRGCLMICGPLCEKDALERMLEVKG